MVRKQLKSTLRRLSAGVPIYRKGCPSPARCTFTVERANGKFLGIIRSREEPAGELVELWETSRLDTLRRIACGYYPSIAKAFGPARQYAGI